MGISVSIVPLPLFASPPGSWEDQDEPMAKIVLPPIQVEGGTDGLVSEGRAGAQVIRGVARDLASQ